MPQAHPQATITLWAQDEHRLGLLPVLRRVWAPKGHRPTAPVHRKDAWLSGYGFVRPRTGHSWWCLVPPVTGPALNLARAACARDEGIDARQRAVLVVDQAGWHPGADVVRPAGIELVLLPAASPDLHPAERLWALVAEPVAHRACPDRDTLEAVLVARCRTREADRERLQAHTHCHWWPPEPCPGVPS